MDNEFFSPLTVVKRLGAMCFGITMLYTFGWTAFIAWHEVRTGDHPDLEHAAIATANGVGKVDNLILLYALATTVALDILGGIAMVTAKYLGNKFVKPLIERHKAEGRAEGIATGRAEGIATGRAEGIATGRAEGESEERRRWTEWNSRRLEAERGGVPFDEPPPTA